MCGLTDLTGRPHFMKDYLCKILNFCRRHEVDMAEKGKGKVYPITAHEGPAWE
jgi:hypothetical protein